MNMKMIVISALFFSIAAFVNTASAASSSYSSVQTDVSGGSSASALVNTVMTGSGASHSEVWVNGQLVESSGTATEPVSVPPPQPRPTSREIMNRVRTSDEPSSNASSEIRVQQNVQTINGSTNGQVHVYRKVNGQVVEDRIVPVPPDTSGKPFLFRSTASTGTRNAHTLAQSVLASSSKAVMIRNLASTTGLPWLLHLPFFSPRGLGVIASTSMSDNLFLSYGDPQPPLQNLIDRVFKMFR